MSQIVDISPETVELLESFARHSGLSVEEYLRTLLPTPNDLGLRAADNGSDFRRDMESLADDAEFSGSYAGTYSREDIYADHN